MKKRVKPRWKTGDLVYVVSPDTGKLVKANITEIRWQGYSVKETRGSGRKSYFVSNVIPLEEIERYKLTVGTGAEFWNEVTRE